MLFNHDLVKKDEKDNSESLDNKELTEEDFIQINKEISNALFEMKKEKENEKDYNSNGSSDEDENENENEKEIANFDVDFFSDNSNSVSIDNISDISENSIKSANVEMNRNNLSLEIGRAHV